MSTTTPKVAIVGAGISGLTAAKRFEKEGYYPILFDREKRIGGRVVTDVQGDFYLDQGFQILLTSYPEAKNQLDYAELDLVHFDQGARIYKSGKSYLLGDPLKNRKFFFPTLSYPFGSIRDKMNVFRLKHELKSKSVEEIFTLPEKTTLEYLQDKGFSKSIIDHFFKPFFAGIFLEPDLATSSRMFEFVYKMFGDGHAALPRRGIHQIPRQLHGQLSTTELRLECTITGQEGSELHWIDAKGESHQESFDKVVYAGTCMVDPAALNLNHDKGEWNSCNNFYLEYLEGSLEENLIGLIAEPNALINNMHRVPTVDGTPSKLLSVTLLKSSEVDSNTQAEAIRSELRRICGIEAGKLIAHYLIKKALPVVGSLRYQLKPEDYSRENKQYVAGDYLLYPSLNAAMHSGNAAAEACIASMKPAIHLP
ncbi:FAD-dependent oxidoreductase [Aureicoccus marinus]|uniref:Amine oxidase domain-containing protein n=1 Tax=Aureicoccus marinus TaxID=754435 RepID=A0A2S7T9L0_9FLAO|nr:FAD-dependent oxidoreductase [Aureicoccus marinus]PQJ16620.1 hypothetical protein BST99_13660 [Aureicoccus marinus]